MEAERRTNSLSSGMQNQSVVSYSHVLFCADRILDLIPPTCIDLAAMDDASPFRLLEGFAART